MLSDVSSLTDLSSEEDASFTPSGRAKRPAKSTEYTLKGSLKAPRTVQFSAKHIYEEILNGRIDLNPEYQRDVVWPDQKQTGLIDSILRNFYIPPVIFAVTMTDDGEEKRTCIDGKQRLTSIVRFMDGHIPYKDSRTNVKMWYRLSSSNKNGKPLPQKYRNQFASKQIVCVEYSEINDDAEREIFQRVQLGVALTPAERMQAIPGPWTQLIRDVLTHMGDGRMGDHLEWSSSRGRDFQCVATALYLMEKQSTPAKAAASSTAVKSFPSPLNLDRWLQRVTPPTKSFTDRVTYTFQVFHALVVDKSHGKVFAMIGKKSVRVSPIEFVMINVLIDMYMAKYSLSQLAFGIQKMREHVRRKHDDIRANSKVTKTMHLFVTDELPGLMAGMKSSEKSALQAVQSMPPPSTVSKENGKRKRERESSAESEESTVDRPKPKISPAKKNARTVSGVAGTSKAPSEASSGRPVDRMSVDRPSTSRPPTPKVDAYGNASTSRPVGSNSVPSSSQATPSGLRAGANPKNDRLAAMRAAKAATARQTSTPPRAPSRQSTTDSSVMGPPSAPLMGTTASTFTGVDTEAVHNALQRTASGQVGPSAQSWPDADAQVGYGQAQPVPQQQYGQAPPPRVQTPTTTTPTTPTADPRMHPSRQAALNMAAMEGNGNSLSANHVQARGIPHPDQFPPNIPPYPPHGGQRRDSPSIGGRGPGNGNSTVPPRHRDRISRFDRQ